jgi:hypothetical protein
MAFWKKPIEFNLKHLAVHAVLALSLCLSSEAFAYSRQFPTEQQAQQHCPRDAVVWVNTKTGVYHFRGQRWYGNTIAGAYECRAEADAEGDRATRNGQ